MRTAATVSAATRALGPAFGPALALSLLVAGALPAAELVEGEAHAEAGPAAGAGYRFRVEHCASALRSEWRSASGELLAWDEVQLADGQLLRYRLVRPNLGQDITRTGPGASGDPSPGTPLLAGPMLIEYARRMLPALRAGQTPRVRYLIAETGMLLLLRLRTTKQVPGSTWVTVEAAQPWLRPVVPRATLEFDAAARFVGMQGQILPQAGSGQRPEPIAARVRVLSSGPTSGCHNAPVLFSQQGVNRGS
jgi:hypothetical protein